MTENKKLGYLAQLRQLVGKRLLITPGVRAIIQNDDGHVLLIQRADNQKWVFPAGGMEPGESIYDCLKREVKEETGLTVISATPISIYSEPRFTFVNADGEAQQKLTLVFRVDEWNGELLKRTNETLDARFFKNDALPAMEPYHLETLEDLKNYRSQLILK